MAITELTLVWLGSVATLATIGMFKNFGDEATRVLVSFAASILWAIFGMASFDVVIDDAAQVSEPILPLAYLGIGFSVIVGVFAVYGLVRSIGEEAGATNASGMID